MFLIVGLGNPGDKYKGTRHNIGREVLMEWRAYALRAYRRPTRIHPPKFLSETWAGKRRPTQKSISYDAPYDFGYFEYDKKLNALVSKIPPRPPLSKGGMGGILLLPETMMNKSGNAVRPALRAFKTKPKDVIVFHDDADIELGRVKLSFGKHSAGHKGVESVRRALGTWDFWRLRIGIQKKKRVDAMKLVLQKFAPAEETALRRVKKKLVEGLTTILKEGPEKAVNFVNKN